MLPFSSIRCKRCGRIPNTQRQMENEVTKLSHCTVCGKAFTEAELQKLYPLTMIIRKFDEYMDLRTSMNAIARQYSSEKNKAPQSKLHKLCS